MLLLCLSTLFVSIYLTALKASLAGRLDTWRSQWKVVAHVSTSHALACFELITSYLKKTMCAHRFTFCKISLLESLPRKCIFFWDRSPIEPFAPHNWLLVFCVNFVKQTLTSYLACSTEPSRPLLTKSQCWEPLCLVLFCCFNGRELHVFVSF